MTTTVELFSTQPLEVDGWAEAEGMDYWLDSLETMLIAIKQRRMTTDQLDRYAKLLLGAEKHALSMVEYRTERELDHFRETGECLRHFSLDDEPQACDQCGKRWADVVDGREGRKRRKAA